MDGGRDGGGVDAQERRQRCRRRRRGGGEEEEESDGSSGAGLELSLRLRTGDSSGPTPAAAAAAVEEEEERRLRQAAEEPATSRRNMTIFYNGRVCAVDVTEVQARAIISMANEEIQADHRQQQESDSGSSNGAMARRCARDDGHVRPPVLPAAVSGAPPRQGQGFAAPVVVDQAATGLSMKRSLQRFLQKRQARTAAAVAPPYAAAGGLQAQAMRH